MTMKGKMLLLIGLLCSLNARADDLATQIESFIQGKFSGEPVQVKVRVRTPPAQWPACELPQLSLPPNARIGGNVSISARCGGSGVLSRRRCKCSAAIWFRRAASAPAAG